MIGRNDTFLWGMQIYPPSSVAYATNCLQFSSHPKGKPFCKIPFALHDKATRANRKGKPQHKMIFAISAMFTTSAMFAQCKEAFPFEGEGGAAGDG